MPTQLAVPPVPGILPGDRVVVVFRLRLKCDGTRAENRFRLSGKRTSSFKSAGASVHSTTDSRGVRTSGSNAGYNMFRGSGKSTGYPFHSSVSNSLPLPCVTVCHHISTGLYHLNSSRAEVVLWVELYIYHISVPSWHVIRRPLPLTVK